MRSLTLAIAGVFVACASPSEPNGPTGGSGAGPLPTAEVPPDPWSADFEPPRTLDTARVHLEPLAPKHTELDFAALMGSRGHLRDTLQWGDWPREDFTVEENRDDLERHWLEFEQREAFAYTVLTPDRSTCVGCVYLVPTPSGDPASAALAYWVIESELDSELDEHLLESMLDWFDRAWPFERVLLPTHPDNQRGLELALSLDAEVGEDGVPVWSRRQ